MLEMRVESLDK